MDRLDRISLWAIVLLVISSSALISHNLGEAKLERARQNTNAVSESSRVRDEVEKRSKEIAGIIEGNSLKRAEALVQDMVRRYPYEGGPRMLMGDIAMRRQQPMKAALEYAEAVDLNPDYLDRKTSSFQGKKLKIAAAEALDEVERKLKTSPHDESLKRTKRLIYYLQRRIAGSCG